MILTLMLVSFSSVCAKAAENTPADNVSEKENAKLIEVTNIMQYPELPTGCESVSLTILLNHMGYSVDKLTIVRKYLPKMDFYWYNNELYGADFHTTFAGNPESENAYGCYAPCIVTTANNYFTDIGDTAQAVDITGTNIEALFRQYIDNDIPVLIWITGWGLIDPVPTTIWTTTEGKRVQWLGNEHCVVLTGYDRDKKLVYVSDPMKGNVSYDFDKLSLRYLQFGKQAVYIKPALVIPMYGDIDSDGKITSSDSLSVLRCSVGLDLLDEDHILLAEVDGDGIITSADALEILRFSVGLSNSTLIGTEVSK